MNDVLRLKTFECGPSPWDTDYFEVKSGRVTINESLDADSLQSVEIWASGYDFVTANNVGNNAHNNVMLSRSQLKPFLADVNVSFSLDLTKYSSQLCPTESVIISPNFDLDEGVLTVARECFTHSRFFNDPYLAPEKANGLYAHWVKSAFNKPDRYFAKMDSGAETAAFALFSFMPDGRICRIELIGVSPRAGGKGFGALLLNRLLGYAVSMGAECVRVGTQLTNIRAACFYQKQGFEYSDCTTVFHIWPKEAGRINR
ncbi:MAG: GNAT family N-acetyltransferase [Thermaerobacter sp.]|nr:GNAT family N-acetyltransferase [Thermaerobacter sp.]